MYLSDAMDMGSLQSNQAFGCLVDQHGNRCALGGAYQAIGVEVITVYRTTPDYLTGAPYTYGVELPDSVPLAWGWAFRKDAACPECIQQVQSVASIGAHLNDYHTWSRPRIADWVRQQEIRFGIRKEEDATARAQRSDVEHQGVLVSGCR